MPRRGGGGGGGHRSTTVNRNVNVNVRKPTVVVAPRRPMPVAPMMMTGMMTGMMMGTMMAASAGRRQQQAQACHHEETSQTIVIMQPFPGTVVAFHPEEGKVMFQTIPIGLPIPPDCHIVKTPEQQGVPVVIRHHEKIEYKVIPPGGNIPKGAKVISIQLQQQEYPPPPPPGSTIVQITQPDGQIAYQAIPPGYPIPPGAIIVPPPVMNNNNQEQNAEKVDHSHLPPPLPSPYEQKEVKEVKEGQEEVTPEIQSEQSNDELEAIPPYQPVDQPIPLPYAPIIDPSLFLNHPQPQPQPQLYSMPPQGAYPQPYPPQGYPQPQIAYPPPQHSQYPPQPYPPQFVAQPYPQPYPPQDNQPQPQPQPQRPSSQQFPSQYQQPQPLPQQQRPLSQQIPSQYQSQIQPQQTEVKKPPTWVPDAQSPNCTTCKTPFTVKRRRHHCRYCGKIFCEVCSHNMCMIPDYGFKEAVRVCDPCFEKITGRKPNPPPPNTGDGCIIS